MKFLIYHRNKELRLLDTNREIVVGNYNTLDQALQGLKVYESQGRVGQGFDYIYEDELITDFYRINNEIKNEVISGFEWDIDTSTRSERCSEIECRLGR